MGIVPIVAVLTIGMLSGPLVAIGLSLLAVVASTNASPATDAGLRRGDAESEEATPFLGAASVGTRLRSDPLPESLRSVRRSAACRRCGRLG
jgi:hypothetical protein